MTEVIVHCLVGNVAPSSGVHNKGRGMGGEHWLMITHLQWKRWTTSHSSLSRHIAVSNVALCHVCSFAGANDMATSCLPCRDVPELVVGSGWVFCMVVRGEVSRKSWLHVHYMWRRVHLHLYIITYVLYMYISHLQAPLTAQWLMSHIYPCCNPVLWSTDWDLPCIRLVRSPWTKFHTTC